jgi:uracil-DNA glycosylase
MKKMMALMMISIFCLCACAGATRTASKYERFTAAEIEAEIKHLEADIAKFDKQLETLALGDYGSGFLEDLMAQLGIDSGKLWMLGKAKKLIVTLMEGQLRKKRNQAAEKLSLLKIQLHARL